MRPWAGRVVGKGMVSGAPDGGAMAVTMAFPGWMRLSLWGVVRVVSCRLRHSVMSKSRPGPELRRRARRLREAMWLPLTLLPYLSLRVFPLIMCVPFASRRSPRCWMPKVKRGWRKVHGMWQGVEPSPYGFSLLRALMIAGCDVYCGILSLTRVRSLSVARESCLTLMQYFACCHVAVLQWPKREICLSSKARVVTPILPSEFRPRCSR